MLKVITDKEYNEQRQQNAKLCQDTAKLKGFDYIETSQDQYSIGHYQSVELRPGVDLDIWDDSYHDAVNVRIKHKEFSPLVAKFYISGNHGVICPGIPGVLENYTEKGGQNYLFYLPDIEEIEQCYAGDRVYLIRICLDLDFVRNFCTGLDNLPKQLRNLLENHQPSRFHLPVGEITPPMQTALWQLINSPYQGIAQKMYLESKTLELLALQFTQLLAIETNAKKIINLKDQDIKSIYQAKEILTLNQANPPTLLDLAKQVGIHHMKLKQGFRQIFGTTPFAYLHEYRMEEARQLLQAGNMNVTTVANTVGYEHLGHFSQAFKRRFGINPNDCRLGKKILVE
jgi:AraC family transcriptional regulator, transcriptional activator of the genes for pyochelin and ferripyochelin receptors